LRPGNLSLGDHICEERFAERSIHRSIKPPSTSTHPACIRLSDNRQPDLGWIFRRVVHTVVGHDAFRLVVVVTARVQIAREPGEVAAGDLDPDAVVLSEVVAGRHRTDRDLVDLALFHEYLLVVALAVACALDGFIQIVGPSIGINVDQLHGEVRVFDIGGDVERDLDRPADFDACLEGIGRVDEDVVLIYSFYFFTFVKLWPVL